MAAPDAPSPFRPTHAPRPAFPFRQQTEPAPLRSDRWLRTIATLHAFAWTAALSCWSYYMYVLFQRFQEPRWGTLESASGILRGRVALWQLAILPAIAVAMAIYGLHWWVGYPGLRMARSARVRRAGAQLFSALTIALFGHLLVWRLEPLPPFVGCTYGLQGSILVRLFGLEIEGMSGTLDLLRLAALLTVVVVISQAWQGLRELGVRAGHVLGRGGVLLALGLGFPLVGGLSIVPAPVPAELDSVRRWPDGARSMMQGGEEESAERWARTYLQTHGSDGLPLAISDIRKLQVFHGDETDPRTCGTVRLPMTAFFVPGGIAVDLADRTPEAVEPEFIIEIPISGAGLRGYRPEPGTPVQDLSSVEAAGFRWVVLKADANLSAAEIRRALRRLQDQGVLRVTLAALPSGWERLSADVPRLTLDAAFDGPRLRLQLLNGEYERIYVPVWRVPGDLLLCDLSGNSRLYEAEQAYLVPESGTIPREIALGRFDTYQDLVTRLGRAISGGARLIHIGEDE